MILRMAACCAALLLTMTARSTCATAGEEAAGGFCEAYKSRHANGSTVWCSVRPAKGRVCPLGLGFSAWTCRNGIWVPEANQGGTSKR
jgi:hypothetical protein